MINRNLSQRCLSNIFRGLTLLIILGSCEQSPSVLVVRSNGEIPLAIAGFDSINSVDKLTEAHLASANHLLIQSPVRSLDFTERSIVERYLEAGGKITFTCRDTVYNWGQLQPFFRSGRANVHCAEEFGDLPKARPDYTKVKRPERPGMDRFVREVLVAPLREPMAIAVTENSLVYWIERKGTINTYHPGTGESKEIDKLEVYTGEEDGLLGIALDPDFQNNQWVYIFYSPPGAEPKQHVSRFRLSQEGLDRTSEQVILEIPTQRDECCHSAGDLEFDSQGNLYIATGDNTFSRASDGFTPLDERPGRSAFDSQKSSSNTRDLRGKILRIHPEKDGTYTIPDGNLFDKDGSQGLPEIYIMGARNPFTIAIHPQNDWLYWGDVGPDGNVTSERGPTAHDEINFAQKPGNYGWPYFNANNLAYADYDFETGEIGNRFDPQHPKNTSVNNTGVVDLPPAVPAMVYYTFGETAQFPGVGKGSRSVGVGEVYDYQGSKRHGYEFPVYYDGKLFVFDWARDWIKVMTQDDEGNFQSIEPFLDQSVLASPIDMTFGPDGALYVLEYGIGYFTDNRDSKLIRLDFVHGNRPPEALATASATAGSLPLVVDLSSIGSSDPDEKDKLSFHWRIDGPEVFTFDGPGKQITLTQPGSYVASLRVTDQDGATATDEVSIIAGNSAPEIAIIFGANQTFYQPGRTITYQVQVSDPEDGTIGNGIGEEAVTVQLSRYEGSDNRAPASLALLDGMESQSLPPGLQLIQKSDCKSCHKVNEKSIGPSFYEIAERYDQDYMAMELLAKKIIEGGSGEWGDGMMIAHPDISMSAAQEIVKYIFSVNDASKDESLRVALSGTIATGVQAKENIRLEAVYTDQGGASGTRSLTTIAEKTLRPPLLQAELADRLNDFEVRGAIEEGDRRYVRVTGAHPIMMWEEIDLTAVSQLEVSYFLSLTNEDSVILTVRGGGPDGKILSQAPLKAGDGLQTRWLQLNTAGIQDIYFVIAPKPGMQLDIDQLFFHLNPKSS